MQSKSIETLSTDLHAPLSKHEAYVESDRCYFCHDAPCITACPTGIDIPLFIRQINTDNPHGSAKTIFDENIFGGMCARVCPTETLCEQACVRTTAEDRPVKIGELQRYATDALMKTGMHPYTAASSSGKRVAVIGAGPAGLSCAHRLALNGHAVTVFDALPKPGGLNEYGIAAYKTVDNFAQREVEYILSIGGIDVMYGQSLGKDLSLSSLKQDYDAVFLGVGLGAVNESGLDGADAKGIEDAVEFIARLRQSPESSIQVGRNVIVIGGGMTAIDAAVQSKVLGAENVTVVYRRSQENMNASEFEQALAQTNGVLLKTQMQPKQLHVENGAISALEFDYTHSEGGALSTTGETTTMQCDHLLMAIGQTLAQQVSEFGLTLKSNRIDVDENQRTSDSKIWAGGDCASNGEDLTVAAVQAGKLAAESIHKALAGSNATSR